MDELRAAGALDVPPAWRKSLSDKHDRMPLFDKLDDKPTEPQPQEAPADDVDDG